MHTFVGNTTTNASSTLVVAARPAARSCTNPHRQVGVLVPELLQGQPVDPADRRRRSSTTSRASSSTGGCSRFPQGLRFVVGSPTATLERVPRRAGRRRGLRVRQHLPQLGHPGHCAAGTQVNVRYQAPSCWNGTRPGQRRPQEPHGLPRQRLLPGHAPGRRAMLEFKIAFPASGDLAQASGWPAAVATPGTTTSSTPGTTPPYSTPWWSTASTVASSATPEATTSTSRTAAQP